MKGGYEEGRGTREYVEGRVVRKRGVWGQRLNDRRQEKHNWLAAKQNFNRLRI